MMTAAWLRLDLRRRWRSLLVLALLVALATATVLTAVAGARRGASAMDRLQDATAPATLLVAPVTPGFDWTPVRELPEVEALGLVAHTGYEIDGRPAPGSFMLPPADTGTMRALERPVVLEGRLADPARADQVVVTPAFTRTYDKGVGDTVALGLYSPEQVDTGQVPGGVRIGLLGGDVWLLTYPQQAAAVEAGLEPDSGAPAAGPVVSATIVGVVRSPLFGDELDSPGVLVPSAGLYAAYRPNLLGTRGLAAVSALVRLAGGEDAIPAFRAGLARVTGRADITVHDLAGPARAVGDTLRFEATALYVLAGTATVAAAFLIGGAISRHVIAARAGLRVLSAVGMTPGQVARAAAAGPAIAAAAGTVLGVAGAVVASRWFPVGSALFHEPAPGFDVDAVVLLPGLLGFPLLVTIAAAGVVAAGWSARRPARTRTSGVTRAASRAGLPMALVLGTRFALEPGTARTAGPVRPALVGAVVGVTGVLAALTFAAAARDAAENPARFGVVHQVEAWVGFDRGAFAPADDVFPALAEVPGVRGVNGIRGQLGEAGGAQLTVLSFSPVGEPLGYLVAAGRMPAGADEVLISRSAADALSLRMGDALPLAGTAGEADLTVVGIGVLGPGFGRAALVSAAAYEALFDGAFLYEYAEIGLEPGVEPETIIPRLAEAAPDQSYGVRPFEFDSPAELRLMRSVPIALGGFVAALAAGAVGHAVVTAVRRRRREVAVLRALGMTPRQSRVAVTTQSVVLALVGLAFGVPLGIALGRTVWRSVAHAMQAHYLPPAVWREVALVALLSLLTAGLLALWPSRRAATMRVGHVLRAE
ncbi:FtsX-like permease family protein [Jiangella aurantiaca]|uniref:FtsX-like permease family protein n=1 Tax=Jiangella aurantiaca TaxID=2530373 RepID=A0A4V2YT04_9ACTN|nr:FtsX-like permease family protein [Jiangella aurantiaca]TDD71947.1 FtsX-like permease family protein [Jiangella aurantiaca]